MRGAYSKIVREFVWIKFNQRQQETGESSDRIGRKGEKQEEKRQEDRGRDIRGRFPFKVNVSERSERRVLRLS